MWLPLRGKLAQASQVRLHLRVFLDNSRGGDPVREYLSRMEKKVGRKLNLRSPHRNTTFQKIFGLPPEEFLIKDFSCYLKRKLPLQGRLFLPARIIGFYSKFFWNKTKFFFLWEDIEDIHVTPPTLSSMGPSLFIILKPGHGLDVRHGAKAQDEDGHLIFHFQSFASFGVASRSILALWKTKSSEKKTLPKSGGQGDVLTSGDDESFLEGEETCMSRVYSADIEVNMNSLMEIFDGGNVEQKIMEKVGFLNYYTTPWVEVKSDKYERHVSYRFGHFVFIFGGKVTCAQQKSRTVDASGMAIDEVVILNDAPFEDYFRIHVRYFIIDLPSDSGKCHCDVLVGVKCPKRTKFQRRISQNIFK